MKRRKSSRCAGLRRYWARRGGITSSQVSYRCDQKAVPHASLSASRVPWRAASQRRKCRAVSSHQQCVPYSLPMCHIVRAGWPAYRAARSPVIAAACER
ncbi:hypothetical protein BG846_00821 [Streptomyces fradiae ATCC 10745 = DSM 40063]|uniref:Uncharacterized protein n=1 Tax=Streptomyces fradiae ATCC 10745 = DSM 40063 TaxID=1319510 RepID=A0A1Y2P2W9_STRFR|nr:hypothetical protein BG846_00821 [Streptomyces fradiae ATCC 10745 = DSM 40063]